MCGNVSPCGWNRLCQYQGPAGLLHQPWADIGVGMGLCTVNRQLLGQQMVAMTTNGFLLNSEVSLFYSHSVPCLSLLSQPLSVCLSDGKKVEEKVDSCRTQTHRSPLFPLSFHHSDDTAVSFPPHTLTRLGWVWLFINYFVY